MSGVGSKLGGTSGVSSGLGGSELGFGKLLRLSFAMLIKYGKDRPLCQEKVIEL